MQYYLRENLKQKRSFMNHRSTTSTRFRLAHFPPCDGPCYPIQDLGLLYCNMKVLTTMPLSKISFRWLPHCLLLSPCAICL